MSTSLTNQLSMAQTEEMAAVCDPIDPKDFIMMTAQLLASMQRETKLREALEKIVKKRRTYAGKLCKDEAADIAEQALSSEYTETK